MLLKNFVIGWRNIRKNGTFSVINITGLSLGIAVVALILFWVVDELSFDKFHKNLDNIYTVYEHQQFSEGQELIIPNTPFPLSQELKDNYGEIENATTFVSVWKQPIKYEGIEFKEGPIFCVDKEFLDIFTYDVLEGDRNALAFPDKIIINKEIATLFFGDESAVGKELKINDESSFTVGAVIATNNKNSTLDFKILAPLDFMNKLYGVDITQWNNNWPRTSILLAQSTDIQNLNDGITDLLKDKGQSTTTLHLFPFKNERLYSYSGENNRIQYIYQFLGIALILILIASINFINLSTAKAEQRRPEVGIRKVMGANKLSVLKQFLIEKGIMIFLSLLLSAILVLLFIPAFQSITDKVVTFGHLQNKYMIFMLVTVIIMLILLSVVYPSLYLSSFSPVQAMKKINDNKQGGISLKNLLVVVQFVLSVVLISSTIIISRQIKYINNYDLGYNQANLIYIPLTGESRSKHEAIAQEFNAISGIENITRTNRLPFYSGNSSWDFDWEGKDPDTRVLLNRMNADKNYLETMGIKIAEGSAFPESYNEVLNFEEVSSPQVILNKEALRRMGLKDPIGKYFGPTGMEKKGVIAGVVEDFNFQSLHSGVEPIFIRPLFNNPEYIIIRVNPENFSGTIEEIKKSWSVVIPQSVCEIGFFDNEIESLYNSEVKISGLFRYFSFIAIFISCIGLFGLSMFIIERRKKEIGVRKVNGAKIREVMVLLNKDFIKWVTFAFIIACPITWFVMRQWLENFAFKTNISWWVFALSGMLVLGIALLTVSWQSWRAATRNPVEALRND